MDPIIQKFIEENIDAIDGEKWHSVFQHAAWVEEFSETQIYDLVDILNSIGCDTQKTREIFFMAGFEQYYNEADDWMAPEDILDFYSTAGCFAIDYETRCELIKEWANHNPGKIDWHWDVRDHSSFEVLCIEDN